MLEKIIQYIKSHFPAALDPDVGLSGLWVWILGLILAAIIWLIRRYIKSAKSPTDTEKLGWPDSRYRQDLIERQLSDVKLRLASSLHHDVSISLNMELKHSKINPAYKLSLVGKRTDRHLPEGTSIMEVFDSSEVRRKLLILGEPGSGKTTTLLQLANHVLTESKENLAPIPIIFECSTWTGGSIEDWLLLRLKKEYRMHKNIGKRLLLNGSIFPLLDALDELREDKQESFIRYINQYQKQLNRIVICSRREEYQNLKERLTLNSAVYIEPLTEQMIRHYLTHVREKSIWPILQERPTLLKLAESPLFLNMIVLSRERIQGEKVPTLSEKKDYAQFLFDTYVAQRITIPDFEKSIYGSRPIEKWLVWLAKTMNKESIREFVLEDHLQPALLSYSAKFVSIFSNFIISFICGLCFALWVGPEIIQSEDLDVVLGNMLAIGLFGVLLGFLIVSLHYFWRTKVMDYDKFKIEPIELIHFPNLYSKNDWFIFIKKLALGLFLGLLISLALGFTFGLLFLEKKSIESAVDLIIKLIFSSVFLGFAFGLPFGLPLGIALGLKKLKKNISQKNKPNQGIIQSGINSLIFGVVGSLIFSFFFLIINPLGLWRLYPVFFIILSIVLGGKAYLDHYSLRFILWRRGHLPFFYVKFLNAMTAQRILQRVGGKYRFIHPLIQDYFAKELGHEEHEERGDGSDIDWGERLLCRDGNCIGVIGPDGRCKECGKKY